MRRLSSSSIRRTIDSSGECPRLACGPALVKFAVREVEQRLIEICLNYTRVNVRLAADRLRVAKPLCDLGNGLIDVAPGDRP